jgi:hypothetical protein
MIIESGKHIRLTNKPTTPHQNRLRNPDPLGKESLLI